jgi:uncharacterized protein YndB with AHSA1/START domain
MGVCRFRALIQAPLPQVWEFVIKAEHLQVWGPATRPVTRFDRPLQAGDRVTFSRRDFFRSYNQKLLVEKVVPYHSLHMRDLSKGAARVTLSVEEARDREATWVEEAIFYSLGSGRLLQWLDRWMVNPIFNLIVAYKCNKVFRRLQALLEKPHTESILGSG